MRSSLRNFAFEDRVFVMDREAAAGTQDRFAEPLETERQQEESHNETQEVDREQRQSGSERGDDSGERDERGEDAEADGSPPASQSNGEDDRQGLDHLDRACEKRRREENDRTHRRDAPPL
jgi:hypothetical protein